MKLMAEQKDTIGHIFNTVREGEFKVVGFKAHNLT
jgi:hypothetical protein